MNPYECTAFISALNIDVVPENPLSDKRENGFMVVMIATMRVPLITIQKR